MILFSEKEYDRLFKKAEKILIKENPCDFKDGLCIRERNRVRNNLESSPYCCCGGDGGLITEGHCKYLGENGCTEKSLACKVWLCKSAKENIPDKALKKLKSIERKAVQLRFYGIRYTKKEIFGKG